jgi:hypothetical protein
VILADHVDTLQLGQPERRVRLLGDELTLPFLSKGRPEGEEGRKACCCHS